MPGSGKSTVGVILAKRLGYNFIDTDLLLQTQQLGRLQEIIAREGMERFKELEADTLCSLATTHSVVATGGSAVYSARAMARLQALGQLVFIDIPLDELLTRVHDMDTRGLTRLLETRGGRIPLVMVTVTPGRGFWSASVT